jgi:hypothetical protein
MSLENPRQKGRSAGLEFIAELAEVLSKVLPAVENPAEG